MTKYICKCGRVVAKSTNADNTGNRNTVGCDGCPYLLPWGPMVWDDQQKGYTQDVKGYECRMSPTLEYASAYHGRADDKCSLHIVSLDLDFLDEVQAWIYDNAADTLSAGFSRGSMRGIEFSDKGRYSLSVLCAQNKKGVAAKAALLARFFGPDKSRRGMTPQQEKAHILAAIEAGKAMAQERKENMDYIISKHEATGRLYAYYKGSFWFWDSHIQRWLLSQFAEDLYQEERPKRWNFEREHFLAQTSDFHQLDDYEVPSRCIETLLQCNPKTAIPAPASAESPEIVDECSEPNCTCSDCKRQDCTCAGGRDASSRGKCDGEKNCAQDGCSYTAKHRENPTPAAPASPVDAGAAAQNLSGAEPASLEAPPSGSLAFDYSGLDDQTVADLHLAEREYSSGKKMAEMGLRRMADAVAIAHDALCVTDATICRNGGKFATPEQSFSAWCESIGIHRKAAERLLQVSKLMDDSSPREQKVLEELSPSLLYAAAKPSAPAELVQAVKDGDITTHKQYQEALAEIKARDAKIQELLEMSEGADRRADEAQAWAKKTEQEAALDRKERDEANAAAMRYKAECDRRAAEQQRVEGLLATRENQLRASQAEVARQKRIGMEMQEEVESRDERIRELEQSQTVVAGTADPEEIERRAQEIAKAQIAENDAKWAEITENQGRKLRELLANSGASQAVKTAAASVQTILDGLFQALSLEEDDVSGQAALEDLENLLFDWSNSIHNMLHPEDPLGYPPDDEEGEEHGES